MRRQGSAHKGSGVLLTAPRSTLPPCDAPNRKVRICVTRAAMQTYPQVREERGVAVPSHEVAGDGAGAASWSRTTRTAPDTRDTSTVRLAGCAGARSITDLVVSAGARLAFTGTGFAGKNSLCFIGEPVQIPPGQVLAQRTWDARAPRVGRGLPQLGLVNCILLQFEFWSIRWRRTLGGRESRRCLTEFLSLFLSFTQDRCVRTCDGGSPLLCGY